MNFCSNCGAEVNEKAVVCVSCGAAITREAASGAAAFANGEGKDWTITLLFCIFLGYLGVHRFYTGSIGIGIVQLLTLGGCGIWTLIDLILIVTGAFKDGDGKPLVKK